MKAIKLFEKLYSYYGPQGWWPSFDFKKNVFTYNEKNTLIIPKEKQKQVIAFGAILTQNTAWHNAMKAIISLNKKGMLSIERLAKAKEKEIAENIRNAGYYNQKAEYLKCFSKYIKENYNSLTNFFNSNTLNELRKELLSIKGIGFETADSILLYAGFKPIFVIDAYTKRIYNRILKEKENSYLKLQEKLMKELPLNTKTFNEMHALIVKHAKIFCLKEKPLCNKCFLKNDCSYFSKQKQYI